MKTLFPISALLLLMNHEFTTHNASQTDTASVVNLPGAIVSPETGKCLLTYQTRLDEALPLTLIKKQYTGNLSKAEKVYRKSEKYAGHDTYLYYWKTGKTISKKVMDRNFDRPEHYSIGLAWIEEIPEKNHPDPVRDFYQIYHTPTPEERARAREYMDRQLAEKLSESQKQAGKITTNAVMDRKIEFQKITGLGDGAAWNVYENELHVLAGRTKFCIIAKTGPDGAANLELARKLAAGVLAKCM